MASITTAQRAEILALVVGMIGGSPGATNLSALVRARENGATLQNIADAIATKPQFEAVYPAHLTSDEFADKLIANLLGTEVTDAAALTWVKNWIKGQLAAGKTPATVITTAVVALANTTNAAFTNAKAALVNKVDVSTHYSVTRGQNPDDLAEMQAPLQGVTSAATSVTTAKSRIDTDAQYNDASFTLTLNQDVLEGTANNDAFFATIQLNGANAETSSLSSIDSIDGLGGTDGLFVTGNSATLAAPALKNVENVHIRSLFAASGISLASATGVQKVVVENSTASASITNFGAVGTLAVANQAQGVTIAGQTATTLALDVNAVTGAAAIDLGAGKAATLNITANASSVAITNGAAVTAATIAATGVNTVNLSGTANVATLTVTGAGSVDVSGTALKNVTTLTVGDGGVTFNNTGSAVVLNATTGAGKDTLTIEGTKAGTINTGGGTDTVNVVGALVATAVIDVGAGDDTVNLAAAPATGATLTGGEGVDTLGLTAADYVTVAAYKAADLAKITGFETLSITDDPLAATTIDLSKIAGIVSAQIAGVDSGDAATISNVGANSNVILKGDLETNDGSLTVALKDAAGTADVLNVTVNNTAIAQNNDATVDVETIIATLTLTGIETVNVTSTGALDTKVTAGSKTDVGVNEVAITDNDLVTINFSGDQSFTFDSTAGMTKLATVNASANTGVAGNTIDLSLHAGTAGITVTGSGVVDTIVGSAKNDTISAGAGADVIQGGLGADTLSGGAGNDMFVLADANESTLVNMDIISDFTANTYGTGTNGAAGKGASTDQTKWTGDVIELTSAADDGVFTFVATNAADAQTFLQNLAADVDVAKDNAVGVALDSSSSKLYIDLDANGTVDSVIQLTGVTTITAAAFVVVP